MRYEVKPRGVCPSRLAFDLDGDVVHNVSFIGGCNGNLQGIIRLVEGMDAKEAIGRLRGIHCGPKATSCPDQLSIALEQALAERANG